MVDGMDPQRVREREARMTGTTDGAVSARHDLLLADPPWPHWGDPNKPAAAGKHYNLMRLADIIASPIPDRTGSLLLLWATGPTLAMALECIREWNLHYRGVAFVWVKTRQDGGVIGAQGIRATVTKPTTEFVLAATQSNRGRPLKIADESQAQVVLAPRGRHSAKPEEVQDRIDAMYPDADRAEMFARRQRPGWTCYIEEEFA